MIVCFWSPIRVNPQCAVGGWLVVWPKHRGGEGQLLYFVTAAEFVCFHDFCSHLLTKLIQLDVHYHNWLAYFIFSMHAWHNLWLSSQDTVFQLWYNLSCSQWLEWCLGIFIVIANVSLLSSFQPMTPPDKLFKDKSLKTHFVCLLFLSKRDTFELSIFFTVKFQRLKCILNSMLREKMIVFKRAINHLSTTADVLCKWLC